MTTDPCDGCGREVRIAGGIGDMWGADHSATGGMTLELADGTEHFLCSDCIEALPDHREVEAADVAALETRDD
ncbi:hypothetical protein HLRTI_002126 [Halorhabdus tiamatea SARL4B]|uniref:Small CPxCG-related zinc finger protein n=1 Tax=Halorhabdus tiamatea SARL4B TaxID=1033806 RepID=F7PL44_9EURY|nr:hypothetical protein [Halorhabdus tiamatea]ERJ05855.1 hypothetical protein HLRTI_002126 [Halorhabdus tiamatea SARL4B]CCQ34465.1 conserved hypothetical protein [Halorhabdus tiamatea SARL4B]